MEAENGAEARKILKSDEIDLVVSDWNMPVMTGLELLKQVRADDQLKALSFVMVTAEAQKDNIVEAVKAMVSDIKTLTGQNLKSFCRRTGTDHFIIM